MSEPAGFAGEFAEADGNKRCSGHRKFFISSLELVFICSLNDKQEFKIDGTGHIVLRLALPVLFQGFLPENRESDFSYLY